MSRRVYVTFLDKDFNKISAEGFTSIKEYRKKIKEFADENIAYVRISRTYEFNGKKVKKS